MELTNFYVPGCSDVFSFLPDMNRRLSSEWRIQNHDEITDDCGFPYGILD